MQPTLYPPASYLSIKEASKSCVRRQPSEVNRLSERKPRHCPPILQSHDELKEALMAVINENMAVEEKSQLTFGVAIVPSCYENEEKAAPVEFYSGVPTFLLE